MNLPTETKILYKGIDNIKYIWTITFLTLPYILEVARSLSAHDVSSAVCQPILGLSLKNLKFLDVSEQVMALLGKKSWHCSGQVTTHLARRFTCP